MAFFAPILAAVSGVVSVVGTIASGQAKAQADKFNEAVDKRNANIAIEQGEAQAAEQKRKGELALGEIQAEYGSAGIEFSGDALGVFQDSAAQADYDMQKVHYDAKLRSIGYQDQATLDASAAKADSTAGILGGIGAGLDAGSSILKAA